MSKSFKITYDLRKVGIVSSSYTEFIIKLKKKLSITDDESFILKLEDGTEVDEEYFEILEDKTDLFIESGGFLYQSLVKRLEQFLNNYTKSHIKDIHEKLDNILKMGDVPLLIQFLSSISSETDSCLKNDKKSHPSWFEGLNTKFTTKTDVLRNSAETRIRGYLQKLKTDMNSYKENEYYLDFLKYLQEKLKAKRYNADYFDRTAPTSNRLCSEKGRFECYGAYNCENCKANHIINPYDSRETRILFSTWNLDHMIEKSRTIIPTLKDIFSGESSNCVNVDYFFNLLFEHSTINKEGNLKLVHIVCHDKNPHSLDCDSKKILIPKKTQNDCVDYSNYLLKRNIINEQDINKKKLKCS